MVDWPGCVRKACITQHSVEEVCVNLDALEVNRNLDDRNGMTHGDTDYYFKTGRSALAAVNLALSAAHIPKKNVKRVLDYACGYGRVLRWLMAGFPQAEVIGVDVDKAAVSSGQTTLGADTRVLDPTLAKPLDSPFDLIWVGSLFTHLKRAECARVIAYLRDHLTLGGLLVCTSHGHYVERRMRIREKVYGLDEAGVVSALSEFDRVGFGFAPYNWTDSYGISVCRPGEMMKIFEETGLEAVQYAARGWISHQDVFGAVKPQ